MEFPMLNPNPCFTEDHTVGCGISKRTVGGLKGAKLGAKLGDKLAATLFDALEGL